MAVANPNAEIFKEMENVEYHVQPGGFEKTASIATYVWDFGKLPLDKPFVNSKAFTTELCHEHTDWRIFVNYTIAESSPIIFVLMHAGRSPNSIHPIFKATFYKGKTAVLTIEDDEPHSYIRGDWDLWDFLVQKNTTEPTVKDIIKENKCRLKLEVKIVYDVLISVYMQDMWEFEQECTFEDIDEILKATRKSSDLLIKSGKEKFFVDRNIMSLRSEVFFSMYKHENFQDLYELEINDVDSNAVRGMIDFIYTGKITNFKKYVKDLLLLADRYKLVVLKRVCARYLGKNLNATNFKEYMELAEDYDVDDLRDMIMDFIRNSITDDFKGTLNSAVVEEIVAGFYDGL